jgi:uncharacterized membrane protein YfcA
LEFWLIYAALGAFVGFIAGLLGVGGGAVIVPVLVIVLAMQGVPHEHLMHIALATSMACIVFTSVSSFREHHARGAVDWRIFRRITPGIILGSLLGSFVATFLPTNVLKVIFALFLLYVAIQLVMDRKPKPSRQLPRAGGMLAAGGFIGAVSSLVGIGGAALSIPFMIWSNVTMRNAIGTSSAIGFPIAIASVLGYISAGWRVSGLPSPHVGYVYLPALLGVTVVSLLFVPIGVRMSHRTQIGTLKKVWASFLFMLAVEMFYSVWKAA